MGRPTDPTGCTDTYRQQANYQLKAGVPYTLMVAVETTRVAPFTAVDTASALSQALSLARTSAAADVSLANAKAWASWWNASAVDLGAHRQILEAYYYGWVRLMQTSKQLILPFAP